MMEQAEVLARLCRQFEIDILYVFGSRADEVKEWLDGARSNLPAGPADVDIGVKTARGAALSVHEKVRLALALEDLLEVTRVDLVCLAEADPFLAANVVRGERLYARDTYQADEYDLYILRRAGDLVPLERERLELILGGRPMTPGAISKRVVSDRLSWVDRMVGEIRALPLGDREEFFSDRRNVWAAESCLRRGLEALFDLGRHILTKGFGLGVSEYKEVASGLKEQGVLSQQEAELLRVLAGYRNRLVHFYHEIGPDELYEICAFRLTDLESLATAYREWLQKHPDRLDEGL
jgi:uncharacterized protein YutE (UPF0331/DUF86 family)/predicted nucleotidyltransferase